MADPAAYWLSGTPYCAACAECDVFPALGVGDIARSIRSDGVGCCGCCGEEFVEDILDEEDEPELVLHLWISNMADAGLDFDATSSYLEATRWTPPEGVQLNIDSQSLAGLHPEKVWQAYRSLAAAVAAAGHNLDDPDAEEKIGAPILTACPMELREVGYTSAGESLARLRSPRCKLWTDFCDVIPSLTE
jgi:hypothetical protein